MNRSVVTYGLALAVSLVGAYLSWTATDEVDLSEAVVIVDGKPESLESVVYRNADVEVTITQAKDAAGSYSWVRVQPTEEGGPAKALPSDDPHAAVKPDVSAAEFKGGKTTEQILEGLAPFKAKRILEGVNEDKLGELGLEEGTETLTLTRTGKEPQTFQIGGGVYGGANAYVRDPQTGTIYIVDAKDIRPLQSPNRTLPDRTLVGLETKEVLRIEVRGGEASATFEQHNPDDDKAQFWSVVGDDEANPAGAAWIDKFLRLRSASYVPENEQPAGLGEAFSVVVSGAQSTVTVTFFRSPGEDGNEDWFARSEHTRALVKLHTSLAAEVFADLQSALDAGQSA